MAMPIPGITIQSRAARAAGGRGLAGGAARGPLVAALLVLAALVPACRPAAAAPGAGGDAGHPVLLAAAGRHAASLGGGPLGDMGDTRTGPPPRLTSGAGEEGADTGEVGDAAGDGDLSFPTAVGGDEPAVPAPAPEAGERAAPATAGYRPATAPGVDLDELARRQWEELDGEPFLEALEKVRQQVAGRLPGLDWDSTVQALREGRLPWDAGDILGALMRALADEVVTNGGLLLRLLVLAVLLAVLQAIENAFDNEAVARAAYAVTYLALVSLALVSFRDALAVARETIQGLVDFLLASLPVLLTLMASTGALATAGLLHPLVVATAHSVSLIIGQWVLPMIFLAAVVEIVGHFPVGTSLSGLARLLRQAAILLLGLAMTVFLAVVAIQGAAGTVADGVALRTAKYLVGAFVPVVGGMLADSVELVVTSSMLLKNAVNLLGMLAVFALVAFPLVKLTALVFVYRLVAAAVQPVGPGHVTASLQVMGDHIVLVGVATAVVGLMFFIVLAVMLAAGNAAVMMR